LTVSGLYLLNDPLLSRTMLKKIGNVLAFVGAMYCSSSAHAYEPGLEMRIGAKAVVDIDELTLEARTEDRFNSTHYYSNQSLGAKVRIALPNGDSDWDYEYMKDMQDKCADSFLNPWHFKDHITLGASLSRWVHQDPIIKGVEVEATFSKKLDFIKYLKINTTNLKGGVSVVLGENSENLPFRYSAFLQIVGVTFLNTEEFYPYVSNRLVADSNFYPHENILTTGIFYRSSTWLSLGVEGGIRI